METAECKKAFGDDAVAGIMKINRMVFRRANEILKGMDEEHATKILRDMATVRYGEPLFARELFAVCACCSNSMVADAQDGYELERRNKSECAKCPAKIVEELIYGTDEEDEVS